MNLYSKIKEKPNEITEINSETNTALNVHRLQRSMSQMRKHHYRISCLCAFLFSMTETNIKTAGVPLNTQ